MWSHCIRHYIYTCTIIHYHLCLAAVSPLLDDDDVLVEFSPTRYTVSEGDGVVTLTLTAGSVADCNYTVEVRTQDGTATGQILTQTVLRVCKVFMFLPYMGVMH